MALPREAQHLNEANGLAKSLGLTNPFESQGEFSGCPKPPERESPAAPGSANGANLKSQMQSSKPQRENRQRCHRNQGSKSRFARDMARAACGNRTWQASFSYRDSIDGGRDNG
jgi:hypothetical protein